MEACRNSRCWLEVDSDDDQDSFLDARASLSRPMSVYADCNASAGQRGSLYLPASSSMSHTSSSSSTETIGPAQSPSMAKEKWRKDAYDRIDGAARAEMNKGASAQAASADSSDPKQKVLASPGSRSARDRRDSRSWDDDDDWASFVASGYKAFPLPPGTTSTQAPSASETRSPISTPAHAHGSLRDSFASFLEPDSPDSSPGLADVPSFMQGAVGSGQERENIQRAVTPRDSASNTFVPTHPLRHVEAPRLPAAQEPTPQALLKSADSTITPCLNVDKALPAVQDDLPKGVATLTLEDTAESYDADHEDLSELPELYSKIAADRFSWIQEADGKRRSTHMRHASISSSHSSNLSSRISRQFSLNESISTRPSTLYGSSDYNHRMMGFGEEDLRKPLKEMQPLPPLPIEAEEENSVAVEEPSRPAFNIMSSIDEANEQPQPRPRKSRSKKKMRRPPLDPLPPLPPARFTSLRASERRQGRARQLSADTETSPSLNSSDILSKDSPLLGRWLDERAEAGDSAPHDRFTRELLEHLARQQAKGRDTPTSIRPTVSFAPAAMHPRESEDADVELSGLPAHDSARAPLLRRLKSMPRALQSMVRREGDVRKMPVHPNVASTDDAENRPVPRESFECWGALRLTSEAASSRASEEKQMKDLHYEKASKSQGVASRRRLRDRPSLQLDRLSFLPSFKTGSAELGTPSGSSTPGRKSVDTANVLSRDGSRPFKA